MKFDKSQDSSWKALVVYVNSQCILAGLKPQKKFYFAFCLNKTKCITKSTFSYSLLRKCIANLHIQPMYFSLDFGKYRTQKTIKEIVYNIRM